jgi:translation initiation factor 3 subunit A
MAICMQELLIQRIILLNLSCYMQMTAHRAFQFCKQYKRTTEFRRLCEIIRNHLANLNKYRDQRDRPDLTAPESLQLYLDTRFEQLKVATELELWQVCILLYILFLHVSFVPVVSLVGCIIIFYFTSLDPIFMCRKLFGPLKIFTD